MYFRYWEVNYIEVYEALAHTTFTSSASVTSTILVSNALGYIETSEVQLAYNGKYINLRFDSRMVISRPWYGV